MLKHRIPEMSRLAEDLEADESQFLIRRQRSTQWEKSKDAKGT